MLVWTVPEDSASRGVWLIGGGGVKTLLFCLGTAYSMSSMEDIENSWSLRWQWKHATQNYYLCFQSLSSGTSANQCFPLRRACLFMFLLSHPPLTKAPIREHLYHFYALLLTCWVWLWLDLLCHELQCLVSPWSLKVLCIYVLRSQKELARYHMFILLHDCFDWSVDVWNLLLLLASLLWHWYEFSLRPKCHCLCG